MKLRNVTLHKPFLFCYFVIFFSSISAQIFTPKNYSKGYFAYPVGTTVGLSANFGELRPNHFHMGLDCKTDKRTNLPVYASAEGYIAKVKIEPYGFGRAIYINHPNGLTTVYAHMNDFFPDLEKYVKAQQYKLELWNIFIDIPPDIFPVKKGEFIAYSGNTGGSQGPHLHFEIRDTRTDKVLNPLLFGFPVEDSVPPSILRLAVYDRCISTYNQSPKIFNLKYINGIYVPTSPLIISNTERVSFGISAFDKYTSSTNNNGIYEAELYDNNQPVISFQLDSISYDETRYMNAHIDYKTKQSGGSYFEHLSRLPGNPKGIYKEINGDGVVTLEDSSTHQIKIIVRDTYGNASTMQFQVKKGEIKQARPVRDSLSYFEQTAFHPGFINVLDKEDIQLVIGEHDLYDSIKLAYSKKTLPSPQVISYLHIVHTGLVPVHGYFTIRLKSTMIIADSLIDKIVIQRSWGGKREVVKTKKEGNWFSAQFRDFGNFQLLIDNIPPVITSFGIRENADLSRTQQIIFAVKDNNEEIKNFRAELDGKWLRFTNDKGRSFVYKFDEMLLPGNHELKVTVQDEAENITTKIFHFRR